MGYVLGGTSRRVISSGVRSGDDAVLVFEMKDRGLARTITLRGRISGDTLVGSASVGSDTYPVTWARRRTGPLLERSFVFLDPGDSDKLTEFAIVQDESGTLVAGGFTGENCAFITCSGGVNAVSEAPGGDLTIVLEGDGACRGDGTLNATFDASSKQYTGAWTYTNAAGCGSVMSAGALIGARAMGTRSDHVASVLGNLGQLADDLEAGATFGAPYAPLSDAYLHFGETAAAFLAARNIEVAAHPSPSVDFSSFATMRTLAPVGLHSILPSTPMVTFSDTRSDPTGTYRSAAAGTPGQSGLYYIAQDSGAWRLSGNQIGEFDLPFAYTIGTDGLLVPTSGADLHLSLGGWGAHFSPLTGHTIGDTKANLMAHFVNSAADLIELSNGTGGTPGACDIALASLDVGEVCGVYGGLAGELIRSRIFSYRAPYAGTVTEILYEERPRAALEQRYFDNVPHWSVRIAFEGGLTISFVHLGQLTGAVKDGLFDSKLIDSDTYAPSSDAGDSDYCPPSPRRCRVDVLGGETFSIAANDPIGKAQTDAALITGYPAFRGYYRAQLGPSIAPWSQVEFSVDDVTVVPTAVVCAYQYLPAAKQAALAAAMTADMLNPQSLRYTYPSAIPWKFRAEAELCNNGGYMLRNETDFSSIHSQLGGWYERPAPGVTANEIFAIAGIHQRAGAYQQALYQDIAGTTRPTEYLVTRQRTDRAAFVWRSAGGDDVTEHYPAGELLEFTPSSFAVIWRELGDRKEKLFQRAVYVIDASGLKIQWGDFATTLAAAPLPMLTPEAPCNDTTTLCYNHTHPERPTP